MASEKRKEKIIKLLNKALGWELRAQIMYFHYASYVKGIYRLHLAPFFTAEANESVAHAALVRNCIVKLGGIATTTPDVSPVIHLTEYADMLNECLATELGAGKLYHEILSNLNPDDELHDSIQQICFAEDRSVEALKRLM